MARRWSPSTRIWVYGYLVCRDGERCVLCGAIPETPGSLDIDHLSGNPLIHTYGRDGSSLKGYSHDLGNNLRLLCHSCNAGANRRQGQTSGKSEGVSNEPAEAALNRRDSKGFRAQQNGMDSLGLIPNAGGSTIEREKNSGCILL